MDHDRSIWNEIPEIGECPTEMAGICVCLFPGRGGQIEANTHLALN